MIIIISDLFGQNSLEEAKAFKIELPFFSFFLKLVLLFFPVCFGFQLHFVLFRRFCDFPLVVLVFNCKIIGNNLDFLSYNL